MAGSVRDIHKNILLVSGRILGRKSGRTSSHFFERGSRQRTLVDGREEDDARTSEATH